MISQPSRDRVGRGRGRHRGDDRVERDRSEAARARLELDTSRAASKVLGLAPVDDRGEQRFNNLVHWGYGTAWGGASGLIGGLGLGGIPAALTHLTAVWGAEQVVLPATGASEPATTWGAPEVAVDLGHHVVYVAATALAFGWLAPT